MKKTYKINAYDMLFFGTGRPFTMQDESWTKGVFPPYPSTVYGFLRSVFFEENMSELSKANQKDDPTKDFEISNYRLCLEEDGRETELYPIPYGHLLNKNEKIEALELIKNDTHSNNNNSHLLVATSEGKLKILDHNYYVSKKQLEDYLAGKAITKYIDIKDYISKEPRIGIATNHQIQKTEEGKLYRIEFNNLNDPIQKTAVSLIVTIATEKELPDLHSRSLGGEGKKAFLEKREQENFKQTSINSLEGILYFYAPLILESLDEIETYCNIKTIGCDNFISISGWDIQHRKPKTANYAYPAGTVFYIEFKSKTHKNDFFDLYSKRKLGKFKKEGFGTFYTGKIPNKE